MLLTTEELVGMLIESEHEVIIQSGNFPVSFFELSQKIYKDSDLIYDMKIRLKPLLINRTFQR